MSTELRTKDCLTCPTAINGKPNWDTFVCYDCTTYENLRDIFVICPKCITIMTKFDSLRTQAKCSKCNTLYEKSWRTGICTDKIAVDIGGNSLIQSCYIRVICNEFIDEMRFDQSSFEGRFEGNLFPDYHFETLLSPIFSETSAPAIRTSQVKLPYIDLDIPDKGEYEIGDRIVFNFNNKQWIRKIIAITPDNKYYLVNFSEGIVSSMDGHWIHECDIIRRIKGDKKCQKENV